MEEEALTRAAVGVETMANSPVSPERFHCRATVRSCPLLGREARHPVPEGAPHLESADAFGRVMEGPLLDIRPCPVNTPEE